MVLGLRWQAITLVAVALFAGGIAAADERNKPVRGSFGVVAAAPEFNIGAALAFYNAFWSFLGTDLSVYGWQTQDGAATTHDVGASLGVNAEVLDNLYPSLGVTIAGGQTKQPTVRRQEKECPNYHGEQHCPFVRDTQIDHQDTAWGLEAKLTYLLFGDGWLGLSAGYRMPFDDPLAGSFVLGAAMVIADPH